MERDPLNNLEHIHIKPLSDAERAASWVVIKSRLATAPVESHFSFFSYKTLAYAFAFVLVVGTVAASDAARPGNPLFPIDLAVEHVESAIDPASDASHARERFAEFESVVGPALEADMAAGARLMKTAAPTADTANVAADAAPAPTMMAMMATESLERQAVRELPPKTQQLVDETRQRLHELQAQATLKGDAATVEQIQEVIDAFEARVSAL
jgi:hypothetical protein